MIVLYVLCVCLCLFSPTAAVSVVFYTLLTCSEMFYFSVIHYLAGYVLLVN